MGKSLTVGQRREIFLVAWATPPGTGDAGALLKGKEGLANPVASSSSVGPSQRAERGGSLFNLDKWLKVRANPLGKPSFHMETRQVKVWEDRLPPLLRGGLLVKVGQKICPP